MSLSDSDSKRITGWWDSEGRHPGREGAEFSLTPMFGTPSPSIHRAAGVLDAGDPGGSVPRSVQSV